MFNNFKNIELKKLKTGKNSFFLIDGITGCGKTYFTKYFKKKISKQHKAIIISKDLFLKSRERRILITKKNKSKKNINQNILHYDFKKYHKIISLIKNQDERKKVQLYNLYNRKNGKNDLRKNFTFKKMLFT